MIYREIRCVSPGGVGGVRELAGPEAQSSPASALDSLADELVRYLLFADEAPLPPRALSGDPEFKTAFLAGKRTASTGQSLRDFELGTHLFRYRCSYMIYSSLFAGLPVALKERVYTRLDGVLVTPGAEFAYLPLGERRGIRAILKETLTDLPAGWGAAPID